MRDLTCESPQYFNIRHTERGMCTRNTKRSGGNLHCIMAFKKEKVLDSISSGFLTLGGVDYPDATEITLSEVEDLDSCESDFPDDSNEPQIMPAVGLEMDDNRSTVTPEAKEAAHPGVRRSGTFTKEAPTIRVAVTRMLSTDSESSLDMEGTNHDFRHVGSDEIDFDHSGLKRSGTFTKDGPTICVQRTRASSSEYDSSEDVDFETPESSMIERSHTFTKDSDSSSRRDSGDSQGTDCSSISDHFTFTTTSGLKRSGTFTKESQSSSIGNIPSIDDTTDYSDRLSDELGADTAWLSAEHKNEDNFDANLDLDLDETLKASDFGHVNDNDIEDTST